MKKGKITILTFTFVLMLCGCNQVQESIKTAGETENALGYYGEIITPEGAVPVSRLIALLQTEDSVWVKVEGNIAASCKHSGCWMDLDMGEGKALNVIFIDESFTIPLDSQGKHAIAEGYAKKEIIPVELLKRYAEDEGLMQEEIDAITEPEAKYVFVARGVFIR
ncbi:MAG: DUF4920 domain-containing protein [Bacteroidales bacterium]|nr:DUF4920 domain-containing protein [Bacteroidales bacterium]